MLVQCMLAGGSYIYRHIAMHGHPHSINHAKSMHIGIISDSCVSWSYGMHLLQSYAT